MKFSAAIGILFIAVVLAGIVLVNNSINITGDSVSSGSGMQFDRETITVPVRVHLINTEERQFTTSRNLEDINRIFNEVNRIWSKGGIYFIVSRVDVINIDRNFFNSVLNGNIEALTKRDDFESGINGYFSRSINANGIAFSAQGIFIIGDITSVNDFRATSHELGHLLGLQHISGRENLMFQGSNGETLRSWEIEEARRNAKRVYGIEV